MRELIWENGKLSVYIEDDIVYCENEDKQLRDVPREFGEHYKELSKKYYVDTYGNL